MTHDEARAHLLSMSSDYRGQAQSCRDAGDVCKRAANEAYEEGLSEVKFDESSDWFARARAFDHDADAIDIALDASVSAELRMIADLARQRDELLVAARAMVDELGRQRHGFQSQEVQLRAAIAKAEGK